MNQDFYQEFCPDLAEFREKTMQFQRKELTVAQYKGFSGGYGSYAQRGGAYHMLRLRMAGGQITGERLRFIVEACEKYQIDLLKLTTCQSVQMHNVKAEQLTDLMEEAWKAGMVSRGGGGDFPRNVMASPLSGVSKEGYFDVLPFAQAAGDYMMHFIKAVKFPRKLKVAFSDSPENEVHATFRDLGFVANPDKTFDVYAAGGLGNKPLPGLLVAEHISPEKILYYIKAMVNTFVTYGNYENRGRARTRFMQDTLGKEGFVSAYHEKLKEVLATEHLDITVTVPMLAKTGCGTLSAEKRLIPQVQDGLYAIFYQPLGGVLSPQKATELYQLIKDMPHVEIRLTPEEGLYIINCNASEATHVLEATADSASTLFETSVACIGNSICQVGVGDSQALLRSCVEAVKKEHFADGVLPKLHISGCPSSCAAHQIGTIGFRGAVKQTPEGPKPAFAIFIDGNPLQGQEVISEAKGAIAVTEIPAFLVELGKAVAACDTTYDKWIVDNHDKLDALIEKYTA